MSQVIVRKEIEAGTLEIGTTGHGEVILNHPRMQVNERGEGFIIFSPKQARNLAALLNVKADEADKEA